jgi:tRNA dimethylallyltransferase
MSKSKPKILSIIGPTAAGKTDLAIKLADTFGGELVSVDSRQIYKDMDIGTAKDKSYPQHLIDILSPVKTFNIASFKRLATKTIREILKRKKLPILVGGSGLYLMAILQNLKIPQVKPDLKLRAEFEKLSLEELQEKLRSLDPEASEITGKNKRRIIRALEVIIKTGHYFSLQRQKGKPIFDTLVLGIKMPREELYKKVDLRIDQQIKEGLIQEIKNLVKKYGANAFALQNTIAYKEFLPYLKKKTTLDESIQATKRSSRRYARRQITWFKMQPHVHWIKNQKEAEKLTREFLR